MQKFDAGEKGYGVRTTRKFKAGEFLVEYAGQLLVGSAEIKEREAALDAASAGSYVYVFMHQNKKYA